MSRYGVIQGQELGEGLYRIHDLVEKPDPDDAPSNLAIAGRYIVAPETFDILDRLPPGNNDEIQLTDAFQELARAGGVRGLRFQGRRYDLGNKLDWLKANVALGLAHAEIGPELQASLRELLAARTGR